MSTERSSFIAARSLPRLFATGALLAALSLGASAPAKAQSKEDIGKVTELNKKALTAYDELELEDAKKFLMQALQICASAGLDKHPIKARTLLHLGVIMAGGFQDKEGAIRQFQKALEIHPELALPASLSNPEIKAVFEQAKSSASKAVVEKKPDPEPVEVKPEEKVEPEEKKPDVVVVADADAAPPADVTGIFHEPLPTASTGTKIEIKVAVEKALKTASVVLAYRPEGATGFLARDMEMNDAGWFVARIPEPATRGKLVHYYVEARDRVGKALANNGSEKEPHVVALGAAPAAPVDDSLVIAEDAEDPLAQVEEKDDDTSHPTLMIGVGVGTGFGITSGQPEVSPNDQGGDPLKFSGGAPSGSLVIAPEIGYYFSESLIFSIQGRYQMINGLTSAYDPELDDNGDQVLDDNGDPVYREFKPATGAFAVLAKATYLFGSGMWRPFLSASVGGGEIRHVVDIGNEWNNCGSGRDQACIDTVKAGPILLGPGGGLRVDVTKNIGVIGAVNMLAGFPNSTYNFDFGVGLAVGL